MNSQNEDTQFKISPAMTSLKSFGALVWDFAVQSFNENGVKFVCLSYQSSFSWRFNQRTIA